MRKGLRPVQHDVLPKGLLATIVGTQMGVKRKSADRSGGCSGQCIMLLDAKERETHLTSVPMKKYWTATETRNSRRLTGDL